MGREAKCHATHRARRGVDESGAGKALLETNEIIFRGAFRLTVPLKEITSIDVHGNDLSIKFGRESATLGLGKVEAEKWAKAIREPKSVIEKLGIKTGQRVAIIGLSDEAFAKQLKQKGALVVDAEGPIDHLFFAPQSVDELSRVKKLKAVLASSGALWILRPKGHESLTETQTRGAGKAVGLVDVKVVAFTASLSAEKYVIPVAARR